MSKTKYGQNQVVKEVLDTFNTIKSTTKNFIKNKDGARKGQMVLGDAGMGKTTAVVNGILECKYADNVEYLKGANVTAPATYVKLFLNRGADRIVVFDDVDIIHKPLGDRMDIIEMFKAATEPTIRDRFLSWERANDNTLMRLHDVPRKFKFEGRIIWITNDTMSDIEHATKSHFFALMSRLNPIEARFSKEQKLMYTNHLIEECDMLGKKCDLREGGYSNVVISKVLDYFNKNYRNLREVTPRIAGLMADTIHSNPKDWEIMLDRTMIREN